jgi:hypothetical protein
MSKCQFTDCNTRCSYNKISETSPMYCKQHMDDGMINVINKYCRMDECKKRPYFNEPGLKTGIFCKQHKQDSMIDVINKRCQNTDCKKHPAFNIPSERRPIFCYEHKLDDMVNILTKYCEIEGCNVRAIFNIIGDLRALRCNKHKLTNMVNVRKMCCQMSGCYGFPLYNQQGEKKGILCSLHKLDNMIDVLHTRCQFKECDKHPTFNEKGQTKAIFCKFHKSISMVNVKNKICQEKDCYKQPIFNHSGENKGIYCKQHKCAEMIDVRNKKCEKCETIPRFGIPGHPSTRCRQHIDEGMIVKPNSKCTHSKCKETAIYGITTPFACENHKEDFHLNLVEKKCVSCNFLYILNKKGLCNICDPDEFNKTRLAKQNQIKNMLDVNNYKYISCDKMVEKGDCFKYRPDFLFDCGTHFVVLEVDENQHNEREQKCEIIRMINIFQSLGITTKFIRYNPDEYKFNKSKRNPSFNLRVVKLKEALICAFNDEPICDLSIKYMFYNNKENSIFQPIVLTDYGL